MPRSSPEKSSNKGNLSDIYNLIDDNKKIIAQDLIKELEFMNKTLNELKKIIDETGTVELFEQGKQKFMRESPALKSYIGLISKYNVIYKQLTDLMPKSESKKDESDGFDDFIYGRDD